MWDNKNNLNVDTSFFIKRYTFPGWIIKERYLGAYEIVFVTQGTGKALLDGIPYQLNGGDLLFLTPEIRSGLYIENKPYMVFYGVVFSTPGYDKIIDFPLFTHLEMCDNLKNLFKELHKAYISNDNMSKWRVNIIVQEIIYSLLSIKNSEMQPIKKLRIQKIISFINNNLTKKITISSLTEEFGIKKTTLIELFKETIDETPINYILKTRLELAKNLIAESNLSISDIAHHCGFSDSFYFSRAFKKRYSLCPSEYKNKLMKNDFSQVKTH